MVERNVSRPWTDEEDELLRQGVAEHGDTDHWKTIALSIPGRSNKACRKRWLHSLQPNVKKSAWTAAEDKLLMELFMTHGPKWSAIARQISGRTDDACSKRYREALDPNLKKEDWTPEEDEKLLEAYNSVGGKWGRVGHTLQRSGLGCRNRWRLLERKKASISPQIARPQESLTVLESSAQRHQSPVHVYEHLENHHVPTSEWPYYPPEAYSTFPQEHGLHFERPFPEPTPVLDIPDPNIAPFRLSSSSLSAALSDPPRPASALPPINTPDLIQPLSLNDSERQPSLSPLSQCDGIPEVNDILMSFDNFSNQPIDQGEMELSIPSITYESDHMDHMGFNPADYPSYSSASPLSISSEIARISDAPQSFWKPRNMCEIDNSPFSVFGLLQDGHDSSSTQSTPYLSAPLSLTSSPYPSSAVDLPIGEQPSSNSLLFSPPNEPHANLAPRPKKASSLRKRSKASLKAASASRLSSTLSLLWNDSSIRSYACGHDECWPTREYCFATSAELVEHVKEQHPECDSTEKPYRCALSGCDKSWKSINGLQYHLQISMSHYTCAMFSKMSAQQPNSPIQNTPSSSIGEIEDSEPERKYICPHAGCLKAYRQSSGLRYHIKNGHPTAMPTQLPIVPPMLEQQMSARIKKLRPKPSSESTIV